jgi:hypothetical protein
MLADIETVERGGGGNPNRPFGSDGSLDWDFHFRLRDLDEDAGFFTMFSLTVNDIMDLTESRLSKEQAEEVIFKMQRKWDIEWSEAAMGWCESMFPEEMAQPVEEEDG